jgi:hypothetical protein
MNKSLSKAIMTRSRLRNSYLKNRTGENRQKFVEQRNYCVSLLRKTKKTYYSNLDINDICDNKKFWKITKPLFSDKINHSEKIVLLENNELMNSDSEICETMNDFFVSIASNLNLPPCIYNKTCNENLSDPILIAINKYRNHPSIEAINKKFQGKLSFCFHEIEREELYKEILNLDITKACQGGDIPTKVVKQNANLFADFLITSLNTCMKYGKFPSSFKLADVIPIFKKGSKTSKKNYRPISILPNLSKVFERPIFKQLSEFFDNIFSKYQCGFRKGYSAQHCLLAMLEKWKSTRDKGQCIAALLTDLSKAFDCLSHELLLAKLHAYGFDYKALNLLYSYLSDRHQRTKIGNSYSSWKKILFGVPQGSILGPLLFNIFLCDIFFIMEDVEFASFADDNTPYVTGDCIKNVAFSLEKSTLDLLNWFYDNQMKANPEKFNLIASSSEKISLTLANTCINSNDSVKLLGVEVDSKLTFKNHISIMCRKANNKLHALARVAHHMDIRKRRLLFNAFFQSQFSYCPLTWMFHSRELNSKINRVHERCLRILYNDKQSSFPKLLEIDKDFCVHHRNLQRLCIEMFKVVNGISPEIFSELFREKSQTDYILRNNDYFEIPRVKSVFGEESVAVLGPKTWNMLPENLKQIRSLEGFKSKIRKWKPTNCPCRICKHYIAGVGFI